MCATFSPQFMLFYANLAGLDYRHLSQSCLMRILSHVLSVIISHRLFLFLKMAT